ncbi:HAMP domain-containing sensor histidine kinase [Salsipaludibacter albus]|uniref:HAMP domain-containing sensor histidine kinase n=1 Tax=Salsipaludibacter albus TaxID=2849650 RepID=UPI001EE3AE9D|nr:HAMP domain-containing sensor histidine kinase [Salsipaludibacter albus]MBY5162412.1 HAMP domain-containing histidine kinase [Salsipaludibacter albus]
MPTDVRPPPPAPPVPTRRRGLGLSGRVGLAAGGAVVIAIVVTSILVYLVTARTLHDELDRTLEGIAQEVTNVTPRGGPRQDPFGGRAGLVQVLSGDGEVTRATDGIPRLPVSDQARAVATGQSPAEHVETAEIRDGGDDLIPMRILTVASPALFQIADVGAVQVAVPMTDVVASLARLRTLLVFGGLLGTVLAGAAGLALGRRMVRPVHELTTVAEDVRSTGDLSRRLAVEGDDEVAQLARTFNAMLAALERIQDSQTRLVADASHELRTPLTSLRTNIEVLDAFERLDPDDRRDLLRDVRTQLEEFGTLIDSLVSLTRDARADLLLRPVRIDELVADVADSVGRFAPADRPLQVSTVPAVVSGDEDSLSRAVRNLMDNAVKYGRTGPIEVAVRTDTDTAVVTVDDHGPGVAPEHRLRVFDRFHRAPETRDAPGSGLGLAIVSQAATLHGGHVEALAAPGGGARFRLTLPLLEDAPTPAHTAPDG